MRARIRSAAQLSWAGITFGKYGRLCRVQLGEQRLHWRAAGEARRVLIEHNGVGPDRHCISYRRRNLNTVVEFAVLIKTLEQDEHIRHEIGADVGPIGQTQWAHPLLSAGASELQIAQMEADGFSTPVAE